MPDTWTGNMPGSWTQDMPDTWTGGIHDVRFAAKKAPIEIVIPAAT